MSLEQGQPDKENLSPEQRELHEYLRRLKKRVDGIHKLRDGNE